MNKYAREIRIITGSKGEDTFPRPFKEGDPASISFLEPIYENFRVVSSLEYELMGRRGYEGYKERERVIIYNENFPSFEVWYKCWETERLPRDKRFYHDLEDLVGGYNRFVTTGKACMPNGFHKFLNQGSEDRTLIEEEKLKKKFSFLDTKLNFEELKELNEWYENLRTWTEELN